jgi:hypothetical protein
MDPAEQIIGSADVCRVCGLALSVCRCPSLIVDDDTPEARVLAAISFVPGYSEDTVTDDSLDPEQDPPEGH